MTVIKQDDLIQSVADALQFISYYHPVDFIQAMHEAYLREESPAARDSMAQILINSRMCATGHRPICQDTGIVVAFRRRCGGVVAALRQRHGGVATALRRHRAGLWRPTPPRHDPRGAAGAANAANYGPNPLALS